MTAPPTDHLRPAEDFFSGSSPAAIGGGDIVHVAVGKSAAKTMALLQWSLSMFQGHEIVLLHVHRPSPFIPTPLGKLPASRANPEMVEAFREEERQETSNVLSAYLTACRRSQVKARVVTAETDEVDKGIVDLVNLHIIKKLVLGTPAGFMKAKITSCKASYVAEHVPSYCEMWFVNKRKLIWKRPPPSASPNAQSANPVSHGLIMPWPLNRNQNEFLRSPCDTLYSHSASSSGKESFGGDEFVVPSEKSVEECLRTQLVELQHEVDESKDEAFLWLLKPKIMEGEALEAFHKVKAMETARSQEERARIEAEDTLKITIQGQVKLLEEREKTTQQLQKITRNITLLDSRAQEANRRCEEVSEELRLIEASISSLRSETQKLQGQTDEASKWLDKWSDPETCETAKEDACELPELLSSDVLSDATSGFCESLRIGVGDYGVVYRGEISGRKVAVKKLHAEFHRAVRALGNLHHPRLVKLIGVCPESCSLVYEYLPGGSLQNYFCNERNISALDWKTRARIVFDIASGLLYLHAFESNKMVHGNLKPENLFLDSENRCKISDYVDNTLIDPSQMFRCCSTSSGACLYTDPESLRTGSLTRKSDVYSFGVIVLQLVTGKIKRRIVSKVRRAISVGKLESVLDSSAGEWSTYVARRLVELGLQCCEPNSRDRPELTPSLVRELECVSFLEDLTVPSLFLCPILREIMHDPHVAADGFTYEGDALRGWLGSGRDTSPMTNLKLHHLELTPNYALRLSIQDWLANLQITS